MNLPPHHFRHVMLYEFFKMRDSKIDATQAAKNINDVYGERSISAEDCRKWFRRFKCNDYNVEDKPRAGRPSKVNEEQLEAIRKADTTQTEEEIAGELGVSQKTVSRHLRAQGVRSRYSQEVPHELTEDNRTHRLSICSSFLSRHTSKKSFLTKIITGDESWLFYANIVKKRQLLKPGESGKIRAKPEPYRKKLMLCVFWDMKGVIYWELLSGQKTLNKEEYCRQLHALAQVLPEHRPEKTKVLIHRDNARPHVAADTQTTIANLGWEVMAHPAWSPDIAPSDYALFRSLKNSLPEEPFKDQSHLENWLQSFFESKSTNFYADAIRDLPRRWALVVDHDGDYFDED